MSLLIYLGIYKGVYKNNGKCPNCKEKQLIKIGGCDTCLNCGDSKCG